MPNGHPLVNAVLSQDKHQVEYRKQPPRDSKGALVPMLNLQVSKPSKIGKLKTHREPKIKLKSISQMQKGQFKTAIVRPVYHM